MIELEFTVWQFVRIMVDLEERGDISPAYKAWRESWQELDTQLERSRRKSAEAFADLMMNKEVIVNGGKAQILDAAEAARRVAKSISKARSKAKNQSDKDNLLFEQGELEELWGRLMAITENLT